MEVKIFHNPECSTSRNTLSLIQNAGITPQIVEYLQNPPEREELKGMIEKAGLSVREVIRAKELLYAELGLDNPSLSEDELLDAMLTHPVLINRPFVVSSLGARLCRPSETVLEILAPCLAFFGIKQHLDQGFTHSRFTESSKTDRKLLSRH